MNRPSLILLFAAALFLVMIGWGLYARLTESPPAAAEPATQPLVERLRAERERRMRERGAIQQTTRPSTAPVTPESFPEAESSS
ncbi:MAG TPA: hypothetical protein VGR35_13795 [Tepidisphaeraceae bacterium]|nr:hypothetical protein [Tepidisphaeraceae bacterium]